MQKLQQGIVEIYWEKKSFEGPVRLKSKQLFINLYQNEMSSGIVSVLPLKDSSSALTME